MHSLVRIYDFLEPQDQIIYSNSTFAILANSINWRFETEDYSFRRILLPHIINCQHRTREKSESNISATDRSKIALTLHEAGRWNEAEKLEVQVMKTRKRVLGEKHPNTLTSMANLAHTYYSQGQIDSAIELMTEVVQLRLKRNDFDHPHTIADCNTLNAWRNENFAASSNI